MVIGVLVGVGGTVGVMIGVLVEVGAGVLVGAVIGVLVGVGAGVLFGAVIGVLVRVGGTVGTGVEVLVGAVIGVLVGVGVLFGAVIGVLVRVGGTVGTGVEVLVGADAGFDVSSNAFATRASTVASISGSGVGLPLSPHDAISHRISRLKAMAMLRFIIGNYSRGNQKGLAACSVFSRPSLQYPIPKSAWLVVVLGGLAAGAGE